MIKRGEGASKVKPGQPAVQAALHWLSRRALSAKELSNKLQQRGYSGAQSAEAIERMRDYGYIDDAALAQAVARNCAQLGRGPLALHQKLKQRGLDAALAGSACAAESATGLSAAVGRLIARFGADLAQTGPTQRLDAQLCARALRFLRSRGFSYANCQQALAQAHAHVHAQE